MSKNEAKEILTKRGTVEGVRAAFKFYNDNRLGIKRTNMHCGRCVMAVWKAIENYVNHYNDAIKP